MCMMNYRETKEEIEVKTWRALKKSVGEHKKEFPEDLLKEWLQKTEKTRNKMTALQEGAPVAEKGEKLSWEEQSKRSRT